MNQYKILSVKDEDLPKCLETIHSAFAVNSERFGFTRENYPASGAFMELNDLIRAKEKGVHMYAAWVDGIIVGYVQLEKRQNGEYSFQKFAVLPEYQKLGIGRALVAFCKNKASIYGGKKIKLLMVYKNESLREFYISNGFVLKETRTDAAHPFLCGIMEMAL